ncbi:MAG: hypothetical protein R2838_12420 [Caldilineaceae bacterium]
MGRHIYRSGARTAASSHRSGTEPHPGRRRGTRHGASIIDIRRKQIEEILETRAQQRTRAGTAPPGLGRPAPVR